MGRSSNHDTAHVAQYLRRYPRTDALESARSGDGGVTLKMLVADAEQGCYDRSLASERGLACPLSVHESQAQQR